MIFEYSTFESNILLTRIHSSCPQCIKMLVSLFSGCPAARNILMSHGDLKRKWSWSVEWLHEELERGGQRTPYTSTPGRVPVVT